MNDTFILVVEESGGRLDKYISEQCSKLSRTHVQELIAEGLVSVNGKTERASYKISEGDTVEVTVPPEPSSTLEPQDIPLNIIFENDDIIVLDKPAGLTVHPAPGHPNGTLVNALLAHFPKIAETENSLRPGIVHRLDKDTSGLMMVAKNRVTQANLIDQFKNRLVDKRYLVLVHGILEPEQGRIEAAIGRDPSNRQRMAVVTRGRDATTVYQVKNITARIRFLK